MIWYCFWYFYYRERTRKIGSHSGSMFFFVLGILGESRTKRALFYEKSRKREKEKQEKGKGVKQK